ncbi:FliO/MopB family protein [Anaerotignum sp.]|uniref:FliO/MopB family protein n=1 Tax=Anaerotignum sp. TaxID=2039241 RepID=UPI0028980CCF|nr:flagellar biosynthetic protein FliO [Anaerotignum sp.]
MIFMTFLSVILILFLSYWFTKYVGTKTMKFRASQHMEIVDRLSISQDKSVVVLKVQKNYYLLSLSPNGVGLIKELDNIDEEAFQITEGLHSKGEYDFREVLSQYLPGKKK